jgi:hypothetical protein
MTSTNDGLKQASVRAVTGTALDYNGDWSALFTSAGIPASLGWNERMLLWINAQLSTSYTSLPQAQQAFAVNAGAYDWSSMGTFTASSTPTAPANTVAPVISGSPTVGSTLTTTNGTWTGFPAPTFGYTWKKNGAANGTTTQTYVPIVGDVGAAITCDVKATNSAGNATAGSNSLTISAVLVLTNSPSATGTAGAAYSYTPATTGGRAPITWAVSNPPSWSSFNTSTGALTGTPSGAETDTNIVISGTDADGRTVTTGSFTITVSATGPATFTMTQLAAANRVYQRSTKTGGGQGTGQGTIPVTINPTVIGTVYARCRDSVGGVTILQASFLAGSVSSTGSQTFNVAGVDARLGSFFLDLSGDGVTFINGTTAVHMGALHLVAGQSLMDRMIRVQDTGNPTLATMGQTINPNGFVYASYSGDANIQTPAQAATGGWKLPADSSVYDSAGAAEFLNLTIIMKGVSCGFVGNAVGGTASSSWLPGQTNYINLTTIITATGGGFEEFLWWQGHSDAQGNVTYATRQSNIASIVAGVVAQSTIITPKTYISNIPNIVATTWGTASMQAVIRRADRDWCAANSAIYVQMSDLPLNSGGTGGSVHQFQSGSVNAARHFYRAIRGVLGLSTPGDVGPTITGATRASGSKNIIFTTNAVSLNVVGAPGGRANEYYVYNEAGNLGLDATTPFTAGPGANQFTLQLGALPTGGDATALNVGMHFAIDSVLDGSANIIYDNVTDGDGITLGRQLQPILDQIQVAAPTPAKGLTLASATYGAGPGAPWGQWMTGGSGQANDFHEPSPEFTIETRYLAASAPGANQFLMGAVNSSGLQLDTSNAMSGVYYNGTTGTGFGTTVLTSGQIYHLRLCVNLYGAWFYINGTLVGTSVSPIPNATSRTQVTGVRKWGTNGTTILTTGSQQETAIWLTALNTGSNFTPPTAPYVGNEGMIRLWHLDGNGNNSA